MNDTVVYTLVDAKGAPLYVGMTRNLSQRLKCHRRRPWFDHVSRVEETEPMSRVEAFLLERRTIWRLQPRFNRTWNRSPNLPADRITEMSAMLMLGFTNYVSWGSQVLHGFGLTPVAHTGWNDSIPLYRYDDVEALDRRLRGAS